uniref:Uncharacterized protein n=1 Tax=Euplotes harpa TaxID=151035 RepID=A0A7S3N6A8_9SPIT|mmetsp:Transcript_26113/g.30152  ORF Transcript_26113/g.30152 Transcript_26113/m.30152 type:complete len:148 (+) Transcript_26113:391-834(+)
MQNGDHKRITDEVNHMHNQTGEITHIIEKVYERIQSDSCTEEDKQLLIDFLYRLRDAFYTNLHKNRQNPTTYPDDEKAKREILEEENKYDMFGKLTSLLWSNNLKPSYELHQEFAGSAVQKACKLSDIKVFRKYISYFDEEDYDKLK